MSNRADFRNLTILYIRCTDCNIKISIPIDKDVSDNKIDLFINHLANHSGHNIEMQLKRNIKIDIIRPMMSYLLNNRRYPLVGVEIGVCEGFHAERILRYNDIKKLYLIDPYEFYNGYDRSDFRQENESLEEPEKIFLQAKKRLQIYINRIEFIKKSSRDALNDVPNNLDFVYIDGNHAYEYVKEDINLYWSKIKKDGVIGGHDFGTHCPGVSKAVSEFILENNFQKIKGKCRYKDADWWIVK